MSRIHFINHFLEMADFFLEFLGLNSVILKTINYLFELGVFILINIHHGE